MTIRQAIISDASAITDFNIKMAKQTEDMDLIPEVINAGVQNMIKNSQTGFYLVAEKDNVILASLMILRYQA